MKILAFYPYIPYPVNRGAFHRGFQFLHHLARSFEVDFLVLSEKGEGKEFRPVFADFCRRVEIVEFEHPEWERLFPKRLLNPLPATIAHWTHPRIAAAVDGALRSDQYDAVHLLDLILTQYFVGKDRHQPLVLDRTRVDLYYQWMEMLCMPRLFPRVLAVEKLLKLWRHERLVARRTALQIVCGPDDERVLRRFVRKDLPAAVIPNGVDTGYFFPEATHVPRDADPTVLFCGAMDYNPNVDALQWFFDEIHDGLLQRVADLKVLIVGKDPTVEVQQYAERPGVTVTGAVPDVRPYYRRAWLQIVPLRIGGGTRLKIPESMAMSTAVVSTTIGAQGLELQHDHDILLADSPPDFIHQTVRALTDTSVRRRLETEGLRTVQRRLSWDILGRRLCDIYSAWHETVLQRPAIAKAVLHRE